MNQIAIIYGSSGGATESVAKKIQAWFEHASLFNVKNVSTEDLKNFRLIIMGTSTTGIGDIQEDWLHFLPSLKNINFQDKKIALFGLGDSIRFSTSFAGGVSVIYNTIKDRAKIIGSISIDGYKFASSDAVIENNFVGLILDEDNEYDETDKRIAEWVNSLKLGMNI